MNFKFLHQLSVQHKLVLGSSSPRRKQLLEELGLTFRIVKPEINEATPSELPPFEVAKMLAEKKAAVVATQCEPGEMVIGCDTIVVLNELVLGKPTDKAGAFETLTTLSGMKHVVCTAVAILPVGARAQSGYETTEVLFNRVTPEQIWEYIETGEPMDKAGAYGIQGMGRFLVDSIKGNLDNVIGLPRSLTDRLAKKIVLEQ